MKKSKPAPAETEGWKQLVIDILLGGATALVVSAVFLVCCSLLILGGVLSESIAGQLALGAGVLGSLSGGVCAIRRHRRQVLPVGLATGALFFLLLFVIGHLCWDGTAPIQIKLSMLICCLCGGAAAGVLVPGKKKRKSH